MCKRQLFELWVAKETSFWAVTFSENTVLSNKPGVNPHLTRLSSCQSWGRWLARNGLQAWEWKRSVEIFYCFGNAQSCFWNCMLEEKYEFSENNMLWEDDRSEALQSTWDFMGELYFITGDPNAVLFCSFHIQNIERWQMGLYTSFTIQIRYTWSDTFPKGHFMWDPHSCRWKLWMAVWSNLWVDQRL